MPGPELIVDGYNVLLALARQEGVRRISDELPRLRSILHGLLSEWAVARDRPVTIAWDGTGAAPEKPLEGIRVVFVEPPAEADDWIVRDAAAKARSGARLAVVTRDRGLLARLPPGVAHMSLERLADDLRALDGPALSAPGVGSSGEFPGEIPASEDPVDLSRLPRRRRARRLVTDDPRPAPGTRAASPPSRARNEGAQGATNDPRSKLEEQREKRRLKWERANRRRNAARPGRRKKP